MATSWGSWHSTGYRAEDGHAKEDCPGDLCPVIIAGYDTLDEEEPDSIARRPHGFDAALFAAFRGGVAAERNSPRPQGLSLDEVREGYGHWRKQFGGGGA